MIYRLGMAIGMLGVVFSTVLRAEPLSPDDPFAPYLDGKAPQVLRELPPEAAPPDGVKVRRVVFRLRDDAEIMAIVASPAAPGPHPGLLVLHGGAQHADEARAVMWAKQGYVAVAPDLPGIADKTKFTESKGAWHAIVNGKGVYNPVAQSGIIEVVPPALKALELLRAQPDVDTNHIGVCGVSLGGYTTTMVCSLASDKVHAGFSLYGCGFYEFNSQNKHLKPMSDDDRAAWLKYFDAGRRAPNIKVPFFVAGATNDFFFWVPSVQATLDVIPDQYKNHVYAANADHRMGVPGGEGKGVVLQPEKGPSTLMKLFFELHLRGKGQPFPKVKLEKSDGALSVRFSVVSPTPITRTEVYFSPESPDWGKRKWESVPATKVSDGVYEAKLPESLATTGGHWYALVSDDRPVSASSDLVQMKPSAQ